MNIKWFPVAHQDLNDIYVYYATKNLRAAASMHNGIIDEVQTLENQPYMAPVEPFLKELSKKIRSLVVSKGRFKVLYFVENDTIHIIRIWNCKRNPEKLKKSIKYML